MNNVVKLERPTWAANVALILIDNPPVNAIGREVYDGLLGTLEVVENDPSVTAVVIAAEGRTFIAGADIKLLEQAARGEAIRLYLRPLLDKIENSPKPVVVALHGTALGGGLELAMSAHYRVAVRDAQMGQPEVNLGIIPGAEGTQRLPRLVGISAAIDICVSGKPIKAPEALKLGLIDSIIEGELRAGAIAFAQEAASRKNHVRTRDRSDKLGTPGTNAALYAAGREQAAKTRRNMMAPLAVIEAIEAAATLPWEQGIAKEREIADRCLASDQSLALMHAFFSERGVSKIPDISKDTPTIEVRKAAVIGAGTMGGGIAMALVNAGIPVLLRDTDQAALDRGMAAIRKNYDASVKRGRFTPEQVEQRIAQIHPQLTYDEIASATSRPDRVIGLHFFSPANIMRLVEIVRGPRTSKTIVASAQALAKKLGKVGVVVGNCWGFVGNRMMIPYMREAQFLVEEGTTPATVDKVLYDFGMAMGIFAVDDMGGIDVIWHVRQERKHLEKPGERKPLMTDKLYTMGRLGQKTGAGWYRYGDDRKPIADPEVERLIRETAQKAGIPQRTISNQEILARCLYAMINEGARILDEGYALRAADIDTIYLSGYGFPGYRGGPMWYADHVGLKNVLEQILVFHREHGELWEAAPLLWRLAEKGLTFAQWDAEREKRYAAT